MSDNPQDSTGGKVQVWDGFVRLFHWSLATSFLVSYFVIQDPFIHEYAGYVALIAVALRIPWGVFGPRHARFAEFLYRPRTTIEYLVDLPRGKAKRYLGHTPPGGYNIVAMLIMVVIVAVSGILMNTDHFWGNRTVENIHAVAADITIALVILHWCGVAASSLAHRENLVLTMITGWKRAPVAEPKEASESEGQPATERPVRTTAPVDADRPSPHPALENP